MAEHAVVDGGDPAMDYAEHERTYRRFLKLVKVGSGMVAAHLIFLAVATVGDATFVGMLFLLLTTLAAAYGIFFSAWGDLRPLAAVTVLGLICWLATV